MKSILWLFVALIGYVRLQGKEMTVTTTDSVRLYVKVKGQGPYLLYAHGGPGSGSYWLEKFSGDFLERHFTMVYLDQRGNRTFDRSGRRGLLDGKNGRRL